MSSEPPKYLKEERGGRVRISGRWVRWIREGFGDGLREFSRMLGISPSTLSDLERDRNGVSPELEAAILRQLSRCHHERMALLKARRPTAKGPEQPQAAREGRPHRVVLEGDLSWRYRQGIMYLQCASHLPETLGRVIARAPGMMFADIVEPVGDLMVWRDVRITIEVGIPATKEGA